VTRVDSLDATLKSEAYTHYTDVAHGGMNRLEKIEIDDDGDATVDVARTFTYDLNGNQDKGGP